VTELGSATEELLKTASIAGDRFSSAELATVMSTTIAETEDRLRNALDRHVVIPLDGEGDAFAFRHALVREAIYADLLPGERTRLHGRFAAAIEETPAHGAARSAELAYHWLAAYDLPRAFDASLAAARAAESVHGYADAQPHYDRAIDLWDRVPDAAERAGLDRAGLLERAANAASITDLERAMALMTMALDSAPVDADRTRIALLKERFGRYAWLMGDGLTAIDACSEAAALVPAEPPTRDRARVLASLGQILMVTGDMDGAEPAAGEAVRIARSASARDLETHALTTLGVCTAYLGDLDGGLAQLEEALEIARTIDSVMDVDRAHGNIVDVLANSGLLRRAANVAMAASRLGDEHSLPGALSTFQLADGGLALYRLGDWSQARALLDGASARRLTGAPLIMVEQRLALVDVGQGRFEDARARIDHLHPLVGRTVEAQMFTPLTEATAELALWEVRPRDAQDAMVETLARLPLDRAFYISRLGPVLALAVRIEADIATIARAHGDTAGQAAASVSAQARFDAMRALRDQAHADRPNFVTQADAWCSLCEAELARLSGKADPAVWSTAAAAFDVIPMHYPRAYALWRAAEATLAAGRKRSEATAWLREASALAVALLADPLLQQIRALAGRAHVDLEVERPAQHDAPSQHDTIGLTRRELEVLRLIAAGDSNRQIAERLFITEGTAGTHVSNIMGKLGARGRTEAAAIAHRLSLVE